MGRKCIPENHRKTRLGGRATREKSSLSLGFSQPSGSCWSKVGQAALPLRISPLKVSGRDSLVRLVVNPRPLPAEHPQGSRGPMALASVWTPSQSRCYLASLRPVAPWPAGVPVAVPSTPEPHQLVGPCSAGPRLGPMALSHHLAQALLVNSPLKPLRPSHALPFAVVFFPVPSISSPSPCCPRALAVVSGGSGKELSWAMT